MGTIEYLDSNFNQQVKLLYEIINILGNDNIFIKKLQNIKNQYDFVTLLTLFKYYKNKTNKNQSIKDYCDIVYKYSIDCNLTELKNELKLINQEKNKRIVNNLLRKYEKIPTCKHSIRIKDTNLCKECNGSTYLNNTMSDEKYALNVV